MIDVANWLEQLDLGQYSELFASNDIDDRALPELSDQDLKDLGVSLGHRRILLKAIGALSETGVDASIQLPIDTQEKSSVQNETAVSPWERLPGERKPVTMLFADVTGSTALTEHMDAEDAHEILYGATQRICKAVENNRGTVCKVMGDGVMAMFGAPVASENHALHACAAALEMQGSIQDYAEELEGRKKSALAIRVGLHSGEVVVLTVGEGEAVEYDASGPTVPVAARMEQAAEPGEIYLTSSTLDLVGDRIKTESRNPVLVKGISDPIPVFVLQQLYGFEEEVQKGPKSPFVGRDIQVEQFKSIFNACVKCGYGQTIFIRGEPGIGKTRLSRVFGQIAVQKGAAYYRVLVLDFGVGTGQDAIRILVRDLLDTPVNANEAIRVEMVEDAIKSGVIEPDQRVFLHDLMDIPQTPQSRPLYDAMDNSTRNRGKQEVVAILVERACARQPVVITVEDLHWATPITLAHVASLTRKVSKCNALLVLTSRVDGDPLDHSWRLSTQGSPFTTIDLGPLRQEDAMAVINENVEIDQELARACIERSAGNPLFLEQLLHSAEQGSMDKLPDSIQSLVLARIDRLPSASKRMIQAASIIGQRFSLDCLAEVVNAPVDNIEQLISEGLVGSDEDGAFFSHALIREGVYASLLKSQRIEMHGRAADFFDGTDLVLHAEHLERAEDPDAPRAFLDAARQQYSLYRSEIALSLIERTNSMDMPEEVSFEISCFKGELLLLQGQTDSSRAEWKNALSKAQNDYQRCIALIGLASCLRISADYHEALSLLDEAEKMGGNQLSAEERSRLYNLRGNLWFPMGEMEHCLENHELALEFAEKSGSVEARANAASGLADAAYLQGRMVSAERFFGQCVALCRENGIGRTEVANAAMQAITRTYLLDLESAYQLALETLDFGRRVGNSRGEMTALRGLMLIARFSGDWIDMGEHIEQYRRIAEIMHMRAWNGFCEMSDAVYQYAMGNHQAAAKAARKAVELDRESAINFNLCRSLGTQALLLDDETESRNVLNETDNYLTSESVSHNFFWFYRDAMWVCYRLGDWDLAENYADRLEAYSSQEPLPWSEFYCSQARTLSSLARNPADAGARKNLQALCRRAAESGLGMDTSALSVVIENLDETQAFKFPALDKVINQSRAL